MFDPTHKPQRSPGVLGAPSKGWHGWRASCAVLGCALTLLGCASLPNTQETLARHSAQAARFDNARGPLSAKASAAVLAQLKRHAGDIDILDKHLALEQAINDSPLTLGNQVTLLQDGPATYTAMLSAIAQAQDHINLETYILEDDAVGQTFADLLLKQQRQGVQVNLLYDSVGSFGTPKAFFEQLIQAGAAVLAFNPINPALARGAWQPNHRDHRKLLIVDGHTAFLGGINISSVYSSAPLKRHDPPGPALAWRDTDLQIKGPAVEDFQQLFLQTWAQQRGPPLAAKRYFPPLPAVGNAIVRAIGSTPQDPFSLIYMTLISAIAHAEQQVWLTNAYFVPDPQLLDALTDAAARGVDVRLILPSQSDSVLVLHAGRAHYSHLLGHGVRIFERHGALLHAKTALIDSVWSTVGSTNLDWRSFLDNDELNAVVLGRDFAAQMAAMFARDQAASKEVTATDWAQRAPQLKLLEWLARWAERLL